MAKRLLTECPYCHRRVSYIGAGILKTKGEHICRGCKCISNVVIHRVLYGIAGAAVVSSLIIMLVFSAYGQHDNIWEIFYVFLPFLIFYLLVPFFVKLEPCSDRSAVRKLHKKIDPLPVPDKRSSKKQEQPVQPIELNVSDDFGQSFLLAKKSNSKPVEDEEDKYDRIITETKKEDVTSGLDIDITGIVKPEENNSPAVTEASEILSQDGSGDEDMKIYDKEVIPSLDTFTSPEEMVQDDNHEQEQNGEVSFIFGKINQE